MLERGFDINITDDSVDVRHDVSSKSPRGRFYAALFFFAFSIVVLCFVVFMDGRRDSPSMWHAMSTSPIYSAGFITPVVILVTAFGLLGYWTVKYTAAAYPTDESIHCDGITLSTAKIPWFDTSNSHWITQKHAVRDITKMRFAVIVYAKGSSVYGLRCFVNGKKQIVLRGLEAPEAVKILEAFKRLGVDVADDPTMQKQVKNALEWR